MKIPRVTFLVTAISMVFAFRAQADPGLPTVTTAAVSSVTSSTADGGGNVTGTGGASVTARGVCWATSANPTTANSKTADGTGAGLYTSAVTTLSPGATYHIRAYATNSVGTAYGADVSFTTGISVTTSGGTAAFAVGGSAVVVDPNLAIQSGNITDFKVSITAGFAAGDVLAYTGALPGGVTASYHSGAGILTFTGSAGGAAWQALLRTVIFQCDVGNTNARTVTFSAGFAIPFVDNGHFYEFVNAGFICWQDSLAAAQGRTLFGLQGHWRPSHLRPRTILSA